MAQIYLKELIEKARKDPDVHRIRYIGAAPEVVKLWSEHLGLEDCRSFKIYDVKVIEHNEWSWGWVLFIEKANGYVVPYFE